VVRTEYIERERSHSGHFKKSAKKQRYGVYSTLSGHEGDCRDHSKTFQLVGTSNKKDKAGSRRKNKHGFSNFTLLHLLGASHQKLRKEHKQGPQLSRSPGKAGRLEGRSGKKGKGGREKKKANQSVFSAASAEPLVRSKKETI
jgi:hypothetical protein